MRYIIASITRIIRHSIRRRLEFSKDRREKSFASTSSPRVAGTRGPTTSEDLSAVLPGGIYFLPCRDSPTIIYRTLL